MVPAGWKEAEGEQKDGFRGHSALSPGAGESSVSRSSVLVSWVLWTLVVKARCLGGLVSPKQVLKVGVSNVGFKPFALQG